MQAVCTVASSEARGQEVAEEVADLRASASVVEPGGRLGKLGLISALLLSTHNLLYFIFSRVFLVFFCYWFFVTIVVSCPLPVLWPVQTGLQRFLNIFWFVRVGQKA